MSKILYEKGRYHVIAVQNHYEVCEHKGTHAVKVATIGKGINLGLPRAIKECDRRAELKP